MQLKPIVAYSTISQIYYMFLALFIGVVLCLFHLLGHGLYKSYMFIISGSLIHVNGNFQSIYMICRVSIMNYVSIIGVVRELIGAISKEVIMMVLWCVRR